MLKIIQTNTRTLSVELVEDVSRCVTFTHGAYKYMRDNSCLATSYVISWSWIGGSDGRFHQRLH